MTFHVGQKVVCIKRGKWLTVYGYGQASDGPDPVYGDVYGITQIDQDLGSTWLWLAGFEDRYCATRFRPVVERKTDISIFKHMLTDSTVDA